MSIVSLSTTFLNDGLSYRRVLQDSMQDEGQSTLVPLMESLHGVQSWLRSFQED